MDPLWSETCWSTFKYFIILIVSTYFILCISWLIKCLIIIDANSSNLKIVNVIISLKNRQPVKKWKVLTSFLQTRRKQEREFKLFCVISVLRKHRSQQFVRIPVTRFLKCREKEHSLSSLSLSLSLSLSIYLCQQRTLRYSSFRNVTFTYFVQEDSAQRKRYYVIEYSSV